jgi:hypothetical protein
MTLEKGVTMQITLSLSDTELENVQSLIAFAVAATEASKYGKLSFGAEYGYISSKLSLEDLQALKAVLTPKE